LYNGGYVLNKYILFTTFCYFIYKLIFPLFITYKFSEYNHVVLKTKKIYDLFNKK